MNIGFTYDLRDDYLARGLGAEAAAEFDYPETIDAISSALSGLGHRVDRIGAIQQLISRLARGDRWDLVFNIAEGVHGFGREAQVPAVLDAYQIPYTFSDPLTLCLTLHKGMTKHVVHAYGINTAPFAVVEKPGDLDNIDLPYPLFAKPVAEGSSKGVSARSKADNAQQLQEICTALLDQYRQPVLVEVYLPGREFTVGIIGSQAKAKVLAVMEVLLLPGAEQDCYSLNNKEDYEELVDYRLETGKLASRVGKLALREAPLKDFTR